jgi:hypothetical protein
MNGIFSLLKSGQHFPELTLTFDLQFIWLSLSILTIQVAMIFTILNYSLRLIATCREELGYMDFDYFQLLELFHKKAVRA